MCCEAWRRGCASLRTGGIMSAFWFGYFFVFQVLVYVADCLVYRRAQALLRMLDERVLDERCKCCVCA